MWSQVRQFTILLTLRFIHYYIYLEYVVKCNIAYGPNAVSKYDLEYKDGNSRLKAIKNNSGQQLKCCLYHNASVIINSIK